MDDRRDRFGLRLLGGVLLLVALAAVGFMAYNAGVAHGLAESGRLAVAAAPGDAARVVYWHGPWAWGWGFFSFIPLFFLIMFWLCALRALAWRGRWGRGCGPYGYWSGPGGVPPMFDEWHRRAHQQPGTPPPPAGA